jgi:hypothetical protein
MVTKKIKIVLDPFCIFDGAGEDVDNARSEKQAFDFIDSCLMNMGSIKSHRTYVVRGVAGCRHFEAYRNITKGLDFEEVTPRGEVQKIFNRDLPGWLTDKKISKWRILDNPPPLEVAGEDWPVIICCWFIPELYQVKTITKWFKVFAQATNFPIDAYAEEIKEWIVEKFRLIMSNTITSSEALRYFVDKLSNASNPTDFARNIIRRAALLPLLKPASPIRDLSIQMGSPIDLTYAKYIPFGFPEDAIDQEKISQRIRAAVRKARLDRKEFSEVVLSLNAIWNGLDEELDQWLKIKPDAMTLEASKHLETLASGAKGKLSQKIIAYYSPPDKAPSWSGLDERFDDWVNNYSYFIRKSFLRRQLPDLSKDPASDFGKWMKDNYTISSHPTRGYHVIANSIQKNIEEGRLVIVLMIDALSIHLLHDAIRCMSDNLECQPTNNKYLFSPIPTITEVCKQSVLTGIPPKDCRSDLSADLKKVYNLDDHELIIASSWNDAERIEINDSVKLLVYKNNRVDEQLDKAGNYRNLIEECETIFLKISQVVRRWTDDYYCRKQSKPFLIMTSDHGFTYGPPPGTKTEFNLALDGKNRSISLSNDIQKKSYHEDYTYVDKDIFRLRKSYLIAKGRHFGIRTDTLSGWTMSHGGLLPEEVIIPMVEWFGDDALIAWPKISFNKGVVLEKGYWHLEFTLTNENVTCVPEGQIKIRVSEVREYKVVKFGRIDVGHDENHQVQLPSLNLINDTDPCFDVIIQLPGNTSSGRIYEKHEQYIVPKKNQLIERTIQQDDFENMF